MESIADKAENKELQSTSLSFFFKMNGYSDLKSLLWHNIKKVHSQ